MTTTEVHISTPAIGRFNAWFFDTFDGFIDWSLRRVKQKVYRDLPDRIVEIGPGVGANFRYYPPGTTVVAVEPNQQMHTRLKANARAAGIDLVLEGTVAEATGIPSESAEVVVSNLVLCTVLDPAKAISEAHRVLKPGGRLLLVEHVRGQGPLLRLLQRLVARPWKWLFEGCELHRDTMSTLASAGFNADSVSQKTVVTPFVPINSLLYGQAVKQPSPMNQTNQPEHSKGAQK